MEIKNQLPLLSDGLKECIAAVIEKHDCPVAKELQIADRLVDGYRNIYNRLCTPIFIHKYLFEEFERNINSRLNSDCRMLALRQNSFEISFLPEGKIPEYSSAGIWKRDNRQSGKPARIIQKILKRQFKQKEIEDFNNWLRAEAECCGDFVLIKGSDITKYYNEDTYYSLNGTLGNSCMRHPECEDYFSVYEDHASMLVCMRNDKIKGRAIVWNIDGKTYMDRVYVCMDYLENQFIDYAQSNKWYHRENNSLLGDGDYQYWLGPEDDYNCGHAFDDLHIRVLENYEKYPYMDSFRYYDPDSLTLYTTPHKNTVCLSSTEGYVPCIETICCDCCGEEFQGSCDDLPDGLHYSDYHDMYLCDNCCHWCNGIDDYIKNNIETVDVHFKSKFSTYTKEYPLDIVKDNNSDFCYIDDNWYSINHLDVVYDSESDKYTLK